MGRFKSGRKLYRAGILWVAAKESFQGKKTRRLNDVKKMIFGLSMISLAFAVLVQAAGFEKALTAADVSKISGVAGVKKVEKNPSVGAGGDLNFANSNGMMMVMVQFLSAKDYERMKKAYFKAAVKGVGEEAFQGATIPGNPPNFLCFRQGKYTVAITAFMDFTSAKRNMLTLEQVVEVGKVIGSRI